MKQPMKTPEMKVIEKKLTLMAALGTSAYFSLEAQKLKNELCDLRVDQQMKNHDR